MEEEKYEDEIAEESALIDKKVYTTECEHYYLEGVTNGNLKDVVCNKCFHGCSIDKNIKVENGGIKWTK